MNEDNFDADQESSPGNGRNKDLSWVMKSFTNLNDEIKESISSLDKRLRRIEISVYGIGVAILIFGAFLFPILQTLIKYLIENYKIVPQ